MLKANCHHVLPINIHFICKDTCQVTNNAFAHGSNETAQFNASTDVTYIVGNLKEVKIQIALIIFIVM